MEDLVEKYKSDYEDIWIRLVVAKGPEKITEYSLKRTADFEDAVNITVDITIDSESVIPQGKQSGDE